MDAKLTALKFAYEEALRTHTLLKERVLAVRVSGNAKQYDEAFKALSDSSDALDEARKLLDKYERRQ